jgi:hypothetical protein
MDLRLADLITRHCITSGEALQNVPASSGVSSSFQLSWFNSTAADRFAILKSTRYKQRKVLPDSIALYVAAVSKTEIKVWAYKQGKRWNG